MKRLVSLFFLLFLIFDTLGQLGNEWIDHQGEYFKIPIAGEGLYRITYENLVAAGFPVASDPTTFQIFHRGEELAIIVEGEDDHAFQSGDYIEFYGLANDGSLDESLYEDSAHQPHQLYNLYSDTTAYFLTYGLEAGKRMSSFGGSAEDQAVDYHFSENLLVLKDQYSAGADYGNIRKTTFDNGEGWMGAQILQNQEITYSLQNIDHIATSFGKPELQVLLTGRGPMEHNVELSSFNRLLGTINFQGYGSYLHVQELEWTDIDANGTFSLKIRVTGAGGSDRVSAGYIRLTYPRKNVVAGAEHKLLLEGQSQPVKLSFESVAAGIRFFDVSDDVNVFSLQTEDAGHLSLLVPPHEGQQRIFATSGARTVVGIRRVRFRKITPATHQYLIISHSSLRTPAAGYTDPVKAYAEYRALPAGGGFDTLVLNIEEVYDQFNYGEVSPRAIFQLMKFLAAHELPEYLFLIGKGLDVNYAYHRNPAAYTFFRDLVPTSGYPASDIAFTLGLGGEALVPAVATGRLTANAPADVAAYLDKVIEREGLPFDALWRKKILHLSGGIEEYEPALFRDLMRDFQTVAEDLYLGGKVQALSKEGTDIRLVNIADEINAGLGMVTFFGHSAPNTLDFDIGRVTDPVMGYANSGKYPLLLMNGCDAGSFFLNAEILGENWVKTPDKGAIGFIAHSSYGLVSGLQRYTSTFYEVAFADSVFIRRSVGKVQQELARRYIQRFGVSPLATTQLQQMVLLGDPAIKIFGADKPDYSIDADQIHISAFSEEPLTALSDSFKIHIPVKNAGISTDKVIRLNIRRQYGDRVIEYDSLFPAILFRDTITVLIRNPDDNGFGLNTFSIHIDADETVEELNETNNTVTFEYFIPLHGTRNLYPYDFSIVAKKEVDLSFQYTDLLGPVKEYVLEVDTVNTFDSGFKQVYSLSGEVLLIQRVNLLDADSLVYYWRTRIAQPLDNESSEWATSSFSYIAGGPEGWAQIHFPQFGYNANDGLVADPELRRLRFQETVSDIAVRTFSGSSGKPQDSVSVKINGAEFNLRDEGFGCDDNTLNLIAFDRRSTQPYAGIYFKWYEMLYEYGGRRLLCGREPYVINSFRPHEMVTGNNDDLVQYIDNVAIGDSVLLFNIGDAGYSQWPQAARDKLSDVGIAEGQLENIVNGDAMVIFGRKGSPPGTARVYHAASPEAEVSVSRTVSGRSTSGTMASTLVGPAQRWHSMVLTVSEAQSVDDFDFTILGVGADQEVDTLKTDIDAGIGLSDIDAKAYPYLRIVMSASDQTDLTAVQLKKWLVLYEPVAEGIVFYRGGHEVQTVYEGQLFSGDFGFVNISDKHFQDSLQVNYDLISHLNPQRSPSSFRISGPSPGDTTLFTVGFNTTSKPGLNDVEVVVNPREQSEHRYENNLLVLREHLMVIADQSDPVLEVTFDGRFLEDDDFVSPSPLIGIRLWDENPFMLKRDTLGIRIFLSRPCLEEECTFERIYFSRSDMSWSPATPEMPYAIEFIPGDLADGRYRFRVEASDVAGNSSGDIPFEITFRVARDEELSVKSPYPNPASDEVTFEVIVAGTRNAPSGYLLRVVDLQGKLVMELSRQDTGMQTGTQRIRWDGRSGDGNLLPGGIYVYRLTIIQSEGHQEYYGKIVLSR